MKGMKKFSLILVLGCLFFGSIDNVYAGTKTINGITATDPYSNKATKGNKIASKFALSSVPSAAVLHYPGGTRSVKYYQHSINGKTAYCLDASLGSTPNLYAGRFLFYSQGSLKKAAPNSFVYAYDIALATALKGDTADYFTKSLAIRAISAVFGSLNWGDVSNDHISNTDANNYAMDQHKAFYGTAYKWLQSDSEANGYFETLKSKLPGQMKDTSVYSGYYWTGNLSSAQSLFKEALKAAAEHMEKAGEAAKIEASGTPIVGDKESSDDGTGTLEKKKVTMALDVKDYNKDKSTDDNPSKFIIESLEWDEDPKEYGVDGKPKLISIKVNGEAICSDEASCQSYIGTDKNILEGKDLPEDWKIELEIEATGYSKLNDGATGSKLNCDNQPMKFTLKYKYGGGAFSSGASASELEKSFGVIWRNPTAADKQRFITYEGTMTPEGGEDPSGGPELKEGTINGEVTLIEECDCDLLREECEEAADTEDESCKKLYEECDDCDTLTLLCKIDTDNGKKDTSDYCKKYEEEDCYDCSELEKECEATSDTTSDECKKFAELCEGCESLEPLCKMDKDKGVTDSEYCQKYIEEDCVDCDELEKMCFEKDDMSSPECQQYKQSIEDEKCKPECGELFEECIDSGDINSAACTIYKEERGKLGCTEECEEWIKLCAIGDDESCDKADEEGCEPEPSTFECPTEVVEVTSCCKAAEDELIADPPFSPTVGMMYEEGNAERQQLYEIHGVQEDKIKTCFVEKAKDGDPVDEKDNKYALLTDPKVIDNKYCKVNCREDYALNFPIAQRVNSGRYFTFQMQFYTARKQCFTTKIDKQTYIDDVVELLKEIEKQYNTYQEYKKAYEIAVANPDITIDNGCANGGPGACATITSTVTIKDGGSAGATGTYDFKGIKFDIDENRGELKAAPTVENKTATHSLHTDIGDPTECTGESCVMTMWGLSCSPCNVTVYPNYDEKTLDDFKDELKPVYEDAKEAYDKAREKLVKTIETYKDCNDWETTYKVDPKIQYDYDETYRTMAGMPVDMEIEGGGAMPMDIPGEYTYCAEEWSQKNVADVTNSYEGKGCSFTSDKATETLKYVECTLGEADSSECHVDTDDIPKAIFRKYNAEMTDPITYKPQTLFYNIYPSGEITVDSARESVDAVKLERKLPVALSTKKGVHGYYINVTNLGEYYDTGDIGRFVKDSNSVLGEMIEYTCAYLVNIPENAMKCSSLPCEDDCKTECIGPNCDDFDCDGSDCITDCVGVGCIYDVNTSLLQKQVTLNKLFPNGTNSYNWLNEKGVQATTDIEAKGNAIYDETPFLSVTISPAASRNIRNYNKTEEANGGYSNETVKCDNVSGVGERLACYSSFIDDLLSGGQYGTVNQYNADRRSNHNGYFEFWSGAMSEESMIGPAWK